MKNKIKKVFTKSENIFCILTALALIWLLLINPIAGIADNGDFQRVLIPNFMSVPEGTGYFDTVTENYTILQPLPLIYPSYVNAHIFPVMAAKILNVLTFSRELFNIRCMSLVYILMFAATMYFVLRSFKLNRLWCNILIFSLFVFMFANTGNVLYFGSFYAEPAAFVFFLAAAGCLRLCFKEDKHSENWYIAFLVFAALFFGTKMQYAPLVILLIPISEYAARLFPLKKISIRVVTAVGCAACLMFYICQPAYLDDVTTFDAVFYGIVTDEETAAEYLSDLGLPQEYAALAGMDGFAESYPIDINSEEFRQNFYDKIGKGTLVKFYITHPGFFLEALQKTARACYLNQPKYLGNRTPSYSPARVSFTGFQHYCDFKLKVFPKNFWCIAGFLIAYLAWVIFRIKKSTEKKRLWFMFLAAVIIFAAVQYVLPTVGNGGADLAKQLYMFNVVTDFLLFYAAYKGIKMLRNAEANISFKSTIRIEKI